MASAGAAQNVDLLVLDDISALDQYSDWEKGKIYELINMRYEAENRWWLLVIDGGGERTIRRKGSRPPAGDVR